MHQPTLEYYQQLVMSKLYTSPSRPVPAWKYFCDKHLVPEIRLENICFYGREDIRGVQEDALYPGHDYASKKARVRLGQYDYHRRLFKVFDALHLTPEIINALCTWEGTRSAKERYEEEQEYDVYDATWDAITTDRRERSYPFVIRHDKKEKSTKSKKNSKTTTKSSKATKDYYSNKTLWKFNGKTLEELQAEPSGNALQEIVAQSPNCRHPSLLSPAVANNPMTARQWNQWVANANQHGANIPQQGQDRDWMASHIPTHYAYATPAYHYGPHSPAVPRSPISPATSTPRSSVSPPTAPRTYHITRTGNSAIGPWFTTNSRYPTFFSDTDLNPDDYMTPSTQPSSSNRRQPLTPPLTPRSPRSPRRSSLRTSSDVVPPAIAPLSSRNWRRRDETAPVR